MALVELCFTGLMADEIVTGGTGAQKRRRPQPRRSALRVRGPRYLLSGLEQGNHYCYRT